MDCFRLTSINTRWLQILEGRLFFYSFTTFCCEKDLSRSNFIEYRLSCSAFTCNWILWMFSRKLFANVDPFRFQKEDALRSSLPLISALGQQMQHLSRNVLDKQTSLDPQSLQTELEKLLKVSKITHGYP